MIPRGRKRIFRTVWKFCRKTPAHAQLPGTGLVPKAFSRAGAGGQPVGALFRGGDGENALSGSTARKSSSTSGGYLPFAVDITDGLVPGADNVVAVRADNSDDPTFPPGTPQKNLDFTYMGGIYRDVYLIQTGGVRVTFPELSQTVAGGGVFVATKSLDDSSAQLEVRTELENKSTTAQLSRSVPFSRTRRTMTSSPRNRQSRSRLAHRNNWHKRSRPGSHIFGRRTTPIFTSSAPKWCKTGVSSTACGRDSVFVLFELKENEGLYINHHPIGHKLNGANRHQDYVYVGNALPKSGQWRDARFAARGRLRGHSRRALSPIAGLSRPPAMRWDCS